FLPLERSASLVSFKSSLITTSLSAGLPYRLIVALWSPALSRAARVVCTFGVFTNFTYTSVQQRKSTPSGIPCQNNMERMPATLKISEKLRKYHFLPRKSIFVLRKNSTLFDL